MKQVTARRCCEEIEQDILEGGLKRPFEDVANPNADPKEERELARPIGCRWGKRLGEERREPRKPRSRKELGVFAAQKEGQHLAAFRARQISKHLWCTKYIQGHSPLLFGLPARSPFTQGTVPSSLTARAKWLP